MTTNIFSKFTIIGLTISIVSFTGCSSDTNSTEVKSEPQKEVATVIHTPITLKAEIEELEKAVENLETPNHKDVAKQLIEYYENYADLFREDSLAPEMLFRAGNQAVNVEEYDLAIEEYAKVERYYRNYLKRPEAIFLEAFVFETYKNEFGKAEEKYQKLIKQYPDHQLSNQAKESLKYIGVSDEERIRQFEKQNQ